MDLMREFGSEFDYDSNDDFIDTSVNSSFLDEAELFRNGRDALRAIAINYKGLYNRILLPALCCESMVVPFQDNGYEVVYYKLNSDLTANIEDVFSKLEPSNLFLYMNYFSIQVLKDEMLQSINMNFQNIIMIEDRTHDFLSQKVKLFTPDYTVCSIRKWLAIPDGGLLYSKGKRLNVKFKDDRYFSGIRTKALRNKSKYLKTGDETLKELFRQQLADANEYINMDKSVVSMSTESNEILRKIDFGKVCRLRCENIKTLYQGLINLEIVDHIKNFNNENVGLYYPILLHERDRVQRYLASKGIFCPVIWPLPQGAIGRCEVSDYISAHMLAIPCDQRYGISDMEHIVNTLKNLQKSRVIE